MAQIARSTVHFDFCVERTETLDRIFGKNWEDMIVGRWPSGLRRHVKAVISSEAWARTPLSSLLRVLVKPDAFLGGGRETV